jgi:hypothetical protein
VFDASELSYGMSYPDARYRDLDRQKLADLVATNRGRTEILLILKDDTERQLAPHLPAGADRSQHGLVVLLRFPRTQRDE